MAKRLKARVSSKPAITITRSATRNDKLVYVAKANKPVPYPQGSSHIVYIGTTKAGARRIAQSAAYRAEHLLGLRGVSSLEFYTVVVTNTVQGLKSWQKLERALIVRFRERYGKPPKANVVGKKMRLHGEQKYFSYEKLNKIIDKLT